MENEGKVKECRGKVRQFGDTIGQGAALSEIQRLRITEVIFEQKLEKSERISFSEAQRTSVPGRANSHSRGQEWVNHWKDAGFWFLLIWLLGARELWAVLSLKCLLDIQIEMMNRQRQSTQERKKKNNGVLYMVVIFLM